MPWTKPYRPPRNERLHRELYCQRDRVVFITIRAFTDHSPFLKPLLNSRIVQTLADDQLRLLCQVFTYCLMPDHLHLLASPEQDGTSVLTLADRFKGKSTNRSWSVGHEGKLWEPRYHDHIVRKNEDLA